MEDKEELIELTKKLAQIFLDRIAWFVNAGKIEEAFRDLDAMRVAPGLRKDEAKARLQLLIYLDQVDEITQFKPSDETQTKIIEEYLVNYNKSHTFPYDHIETKKHMEFVKWIKSIGGDIRKTHLKVYSSTYRGLHATVDIAEDEEILKIPFRNGITLDSLRGTELGKAIVEKKLMEEELTKFIYPIIYILEERANPNSKLKPYLDVLPEKATSHPAFFNENQQAWLKGSNIIEQIKLDLETVKKYYSLIGNSVPAFSSKHSLESFAHTFYILNSRYFGVFQGGYRITALVPYADMPNTGGKEEENTTWDYDYVKHEFKLVATKDIKKGDPLIINYGHGSNSTYFSFYGMVLDGEEYNAAVFVMRFTEAIPNHELKIKLLHKKETNSKLCRFYQAYELRKECNSRFMSFCRFYWSDADHITLCNNVDPKVDNIENMKIGKRKAKFAPSSREYEKTILENLLLLAQGSLKAYPTDLATDEKALKKEGISYEETTCLKLIIGEKKSLKSLIEMAQLGIHLLSMESSEKAKAYFDNFLNPKPRFAPYIEEELLLLQW